MGKYIFIAFLLHAGFLALLLKPSWKDLSLQGKAFLTGSSPIQPNQEEAVPIQKKNNKKLKKNPVQEKVVQKKKLAKKKHLKKAVKKKPISVKKEDTPEAKKLPPPSVQAKILSGVSHPVSLAIKKELPEDAVLEDSTPEDLMPKDSVPKDSVPKDSVPKDSVKEPVSDLSPSDLKQDQATSKEALPPSSEIHPLAPTPPPKRWNLQPEDVAQAELEKELILLTPEEKNLYPSVSHSSNENLGESANEPYPKAENGSGRN